MELLLAFVCIAVIAIAALLFISEPKRGSFASIVVFVNALLAGAPGTLALTGHGLDTTLAGTFITGPIPLRIDALSGWFLLLINFTLVTGAFYGVGYMKAYRGSGSRITLHWAAFLLVQATLTLLCIVQNTLVFMLLLEVMALAAFLLVIFEHHKKETLRSGINYLVQAHLSVVFLTIGFVWVVARTGSYDFQAMADFATENNSHTGLALMFCLFVGFGFKAGFVPFHTWLPYAHPAAPAHVSGVMSGVIIKIGIYGILRTLLLVKTDYVAMGFGLLFVSVVTGVYGVMLAIVQHNLKKLLAYHSVENIGIIGIGMGVGSLGLGYGNSYLTVLGFAGALLHMLNHSLFKSLLFFTAGSVYQAVHTLDVEKLGGLVKRMPHTAVLFLVAALAICGLPPFNGFVSEFLIYSGLLKGLSGGTAAPLSLMVALFGLVLIGGLAMLCFTKAFGVVFLGTPRHHWHTPPQEMPWQMLLPQYFTLGLIAAIGLMPLLFFQVLEAPLALFTAKLPAEVSVTATLAGTGHVLAWVSGCAAGFLVLAGGIYFLRKKLSAVKPAAVGPTWGCGYVGDAAKMQYTASSFVRTYRKLAEPALSIEKHKTEVSGIFPQGGCHEIHTYDKLEHALVDLPQRLTFRLLDKWNFLQNGNPQFYLLYGVVFIVLVMLAPVLFDLVKGLVAFFNQI
ncbi:MAG: hypothetical protein EPO28_12565 [Saprospiraceae bacterium]|nr:MAG: hypothetical protein EPO28_12565 [Saprospiraceae bacterium]